MTAFGMPFLLELDSVEACAALCSELRLSFVELNMNVPVCQTDRLTAETLLALREKYGIGFTLHMDEEADPFCFNPVVRAAWLESFRQALHLCVEAGMPVLNMHMPKGVYFTLPGERVFLQQRYHDDFMASVRFFRARVEAWTAGSGTTVCVENTDGFTTAGLQALETLLESDAFGLTLDTGHCHAAGNADLPFYDRHRDRLRHMHAHDCAGKRDHLPFGTGEVDLRERLCRAAKTGARVVLEIKTAAALRATVEALPRYLQEKPVDGRCGDAPL